MHFTETLITEKFEYQKCNIVCCHAKSTHISMYTKIPQIKYIFMLLHKHAFTHTHTHACMHTPCTHNLWISRNRIMGANINARFFCSLVFYSIYWASEYKNHYLKGIIPSLKIHPTPPKHMQFYFNTRPQFLLCKIGRNIALQTMPLWFFLCQSFYLNSEGFFFSPLWTAK